MRVKGESVHRRCFVWTFDFSLTSPGSLSESTMIQSSPAQRQLLQFTNEQ